RAVITTIAPEYFRVCLTPPMARTTERMRIQRKRVTPMERPNQEAIWSPTKAPNHPIKNTVERLNPWFLSEMVAKATISDSEGTIGKKPSTRLNKNSARGIHQASAAPRISSSIKSSTFGFLYRMSANDVDNQRW